MWCVYPRMQIILYLNKYQTRLNETSTQHFWTFFWYLPFLSFEFQAVIQVWELSKLRHCLFGIPNITVVEQKIPFLNYRVGSCQIWTDFNILGAIWKVSLSSIRCLNFIKIMLYLCQWQAENLFLCFGDASKAVLEIGRFTWLDYSTKFKTLKR